LQVGLKNALRQAPDVILIGEIRDMETMSAAIAYAQSGHLVLSTLHANNANNALNRIISFYAPENRRVMLADLSATLKAIVSQRLVRGKDGNRLPAVELLLNTRHVAELIEQGHLTDVKEAMEKSLAPGSQTFEQALMHMVQTGQIARSAGQRRLAHQPALAARELRKDDARPKPVEPPQPARADTDGPSFSSSSQHLIDTAPHALNCSGSKLRPMPQGAPVAAHRGERAVSRSAPRRALGPDAERWLTRVPWDSLLNRRGQSWRKLEDSQRREVVDRDSLIELLLAQPLLVKRPVLEASDRLLIGFSEAAYTSAFPQAGKAVGAPGARLRPRRSRRSRTAWRSAACHPGSGIFSVDGAQATLRPFRQPVCPASVSAACPPPVSSTAQPVRPIRCQRLTTSRIRAARRPSADVAAEGLHAARQGLPA
jgi:hypothetical protein